jgi:hypothetical protein
MNIRLFITGLASVMFVSAAFAQQYFVDDGEMKFRTNGGRIWKTLESWQKDT